jgi:hypothetical protein
MYVVVNGGILKEKRAAICSVAGLPDLSWYNISKQRKYTNIFHCKALQNLPKL